MILTNRGSPIADFFAVRPAPSPLDLLWVNRANVQGAESICGYLDFVGQMPDCKANSRHRNQGSCSHSIALRHIAESSPVREPSGFSPRRVYRPGGITSVFCAKCGTTVNDGAGFCNACACSGGRRARRHQRIQSLRGPTLFNIIGALTYLGGLITGIIFLAVAPYNKDPFVRFHAFQSIFLSLAYIVVSIVLGAVFGMFFAAGAGFLWSLLTLAISLVRLAFLLLWLFMMYKAYNNERFSLPIIGPLAASVRFFPS